VVRLTRLAKELSQPPREILLAHITLPEGLHSTLLSTL
jgi:hypothetical protein